MFLGSIVSTVAKYATVAYSIIKAALPILKAMRPAVEEIDEVFSKIEEGIASGGVAADDFLDKNLPAIIALEHATGKGVVVMSQLNELASKLRIYSQEQTPDTITEEEGLDLINRIYELRSLLSGWKPELDDAIAKISAVD